MAMRRSILSLLPRHRVGIMNVGIRRYANGEGMYDDMDLLTGIQKKELLAHIAGECDPFHIMPIKRGATAPGTREKPILVPSTMKSRMLGCLCCDDQNHIEFMVIHKGKPTRCGCGYWFVLAAVPPLE